jgi:hypothetical protein
VSNNGSAVIINSNVGRSVVKTATKESQSTVKESALKKTIKELEDRISQIRRQLGEQ